MDEIDSIEGLRGQVRVNGEVLSDTKVEDFVYTPAELLAYVSISDRLQPGDLIGSGTMGFGAGVEIGKFLKPGDVILQVAGETVSQPGDVSNGIKKAIDKAKDKDKVNVLVQVKSGDQTRFVALSLKKA